MDNDATALIYLAGCVVLALTLAAQWRDDAGLDAAAESVAFGLIVGGAVLMVVLRIARTVAGRFMAAAPRTPMQTSEAPPDQADVNRQLPADSNEDEEELAAGPSNDVASEVVAIEGLEPTAKATRRPYPPPRAAMSEHELRKLRAIRKLKQRAVAPLLQDVVDAARVVTAPPAALSPSRGGRGNVHRELAPGVDVRYHLL